MERADIGNVEGDIATAHPRDYVPVARFYCAWSYGAGWKACACSASCIVTSGGH